MHCPYCAAPIEILTTACSFCGAASLLGERYEIRARIGRGGMGEVFRAYDRRLDTDVALKRLPPQFATDPALRASLAREARVMARLSNASIVRLFDLEEYAGNLYLILEYVPGPSLAALLRSGFRPSLAEAAPLLQDVCLGLRTAHRNGVIHRDLKPSNLLLALEGEERSAFEKTQALPPNLRNAAVKIADFGIATAVRESQATFTGEFAGTPGYTAPELLQGGAACAATDVYALGALTCEMLTGCLPGGRNTIAGVPAAVSELIVRASAFHPAQRFRSAEDFSSALAAVLEGRPPAAVSSHSRPKRMVAVVGGSIGLLAIIGGLAYFADSRRHHRANFAVYERPDDSPAMEFHSPPRMDELPPIVEAARGRLSPSGLPGPQKPKLRWQVILPLTIGMRIEAIGSDGTVYLHAIDHLIAVRDGQLRWGFKMGLGGVSGLRIDEDGRIWYNSLENLYCFNRDGKGGRVPRDSSAPKRPSYRDAACLMNGRLRGAGWQYELDAACSPAGAVGGADGTVYGATDAPQVIAVRAGKPIWKTTTPCTPERMALFTAGSVFYTCQDRTIHAVSAGRELWSAKADGVISNNFLTGADAIYYGDSDRQTGATHAHAIDANGRELWKVDTGRVSTSSLGMDGQRRLYISGMAPRGRLMCFSD